MRKWAIVVLALAWLVWELIAAFDGSTSTWPLTEVVVEYVPAWITLPAIVVLVLWLPTHFAIRYARRRRREHTGS